MARGSVEAAMAARREAAEAAVRREHPDAEKLTVSMAHGRVIVDAQLPDAEPVRYEHTEDLDTLAAEQAEASTRIRRVIYSPPPEAA